MRPFFFLKTKQNCLDKFKVEMIASQTETMIELVKCILCKYEDSSWISNVQIKTKAQQLTPVFQGMGKEGDKILGFGG